MPSVDASRATRHDVGTTRLGPFAMRWTEAGGTDSPPVLLLHGIYAGAHSYEWRNLVPHLAPDHRVRVPDLLGSGTSDRPDLEYTPAIVQSAVDALLADVGPDAIVVASSLTGAYAIRSVATGTRVRSLTVITPTGLGVRRPRAGRSIDVISTAARHTPFGDLLVVALTSKPSVRWFQTNKTYVSPDVLTDEELEATRCTGRLPNAKHLQLAFVFGRLAIDLDPAEIAAANPTVIWGCGQKFVDNREADSWRRTGVRVAELESGLPQVEQPAEVARIIDAEVDGA